MTLDELIKDIDMHLPGNRFDNHAKTMWINEIEGKIYDEIIAPAKKNTEIKKSSIIDEIDPLNMCACSCGRQNSAADEITPYRYPENAATKLLCQDRFCDVYIHYVLAKMHAADSEIDEYNNEVLLYEASYQDFAAWHIRHHRRNL